MRKLTLTNHVQSNTTVLENEFIDQYMAKANGEYVKVYLTISRIADLLDHTEKDVIRALNYWKNQGLLYYESSSSSQQEPAVRPSEAPFADAHAEPAADQDASTADMPSIQQYRSRKEFRQLLFVAEQYLGKTLTVTDINTITYFYEDLHMSADLIEHLIEYCVENGHKSIHYIRQVALSWHARQITTVDEAKSESLSYSRGCYSVLNAFGIKGRSPAASELAFIKKWNEEYGFSPDIIVEAVNRTINAIHQPSFSYADSILKDWLEKGVRSSSDIAALDEAFFKEKEQKKKSCAPPQFKTKFSNFDERSYDMDELEQKLLQN